MSQTTLSVTLVVLPAAEWVRWRQREVEVQHCNRLVAHQAGLRGVRARNSGEVLRVFCSHILVAQTRSTEPGQSRG